MDRQAQMCPFDTSQMLFALDLLLKKQQEHDAERGDPRGTVLMESRGLHVSSSPQTQRGWGGL